MEFLAQLLVLGGDADRASVQVTFAHHDAPHGDQRRRCKAHLLSTQKSRDDNVSTGLKSTVRLDHNPAPEVIKH